ncbi:hypothetical protein JNW88_23960, partial [Micromonospora sp. ATA32]|nr:hypothetical protein [Micromonospora sp. ATA32]
MSTVGRDIAYRGFRLPADLAAGASDGLVAGAGGLCSARPRRLDHTDPHTGATGRYDLGSWTSPPVPTGFAVREVVPSWTAEAPHGCWLRVELRGWHGDAPATGWYVLAHWAASDGTPRRTSVPDQRDDAARVGADTRPRQLDLAAGAHRLRRPRGGPVLDGGGPARLLA